MSKKLCEQGYNDFYSVDDLPLTEDEKEMVLEWYAQKIWGGLQGRGHCKSYDPLIIEGKVAHSYIFNLNGLAYRTDGGRHHNFKTLVQLEERLENEMKESAKRYPEDLEVDLLKAKELAKKLREFETSPAESLAHWHDGNSKPCYESNCILTGFTSEPSLPEADAELDKILDGIDKDECEYENGWWETSKGAEFGAMKKREIIAFIKSEQLKLLRGLRDKKQITRVWNGEELSINFVEAIPLSDIDTAIFNIERSK